MSRDPFGEQAALRLLEGAEEAPASEASTDPSPATAPRPSATPLPGGLTWDHVVRGERSALEALFTRWMPVTLQWCRRMGGPRVDAEQAAQEVFLVVLRRVHTVRAAEAFPSWLYAVTRRVLAQHRRHAWGNRWDAGQQVDLLRFPPGGRPAYERAEVVRLVWELLDQLPDPLREVLVLCEVEERTDTEAAEILGIPVGTTKSRLRRARAAFHELATARGLSPGGET